MAKEPLKNFVFKKHMNIGEADAEHDTLYLEECFEDIGDYDVLQNTLSPQAIIVGRTGIGKSALLEQLEKTEQKVIRLEPEELAIRHVSNSNVLRFFEESGVNLDVFYNLLWQHVFAVELIKNRYNIESEVAKENFFVNIKNKLSGNNSKQKAINYIEEWGGKFWLDTESRVKEITEKLEDNLQTTVGSNVPHFKFGFGSSSNLSEEQKTEVVYYGKQVVSSIQIKKLSKIIDLLAEDIFDDPQNKTYILIDRLDENWVDDQLRYKLIRALIETVKKFRTIENIKIIFTLRTDLLHRVLENTKDSGFQLEKYSSLFLELGWNKDQLVSLLDRRVNHLLKHKYTKSEVSFGDIFPNKIDKTTSADYILDRTLLRPRDAIMFVNECLIESQGKTQITPTIMKLAEKSYSSKRIESLKYEWFVEHPALDHYIDILNKKTARFKVNSIVDSEIEDLILRITESKYQYEDSVIKSAVSYLNSKYPMTDTYRNQLIQNLLFTLYKIGVIGIKVDGTSSVKWIHDRTQDLTPQKIMNTSIVYIHKVLWRPLAIDARV
ncbi:DNA repair ATPase [Vibrio albus]|uniref:DNA repair ATPase n=1 Tax=Vibrio albus TaxID=2200953 RepID=A0A2U3BBJ0_9VIBR|nr:DNA repair ATPase [Vibrio albus]PWI34156.1 DNA repair ATPase [Vibrio albus]